MRFLNQIVIYMFLMLSWSMMGQETSNKSEMITTEFISDSGKIVAYNLTVANKSHFIIKDLANAKEYKLEIGSKKFYINDYMGAIYDFKNKELHFIDFKTQQIKVLQNIGKLDILKNLDRLVYMELKTNTLSILDLKTFKTTSFDKVKFFSLSPNESKLVMIDENNSSVLLDLKTNKKEVFPNLDKVEDPIKKVVFNELNSVFYLITNSVDDMFVYEVQKNDLKKIGKYPIVNEVEKTVIDTLFNDLRLLPNDELVVGVKPLQKKRSEQDADVQIWRGAQKGYTPNVDHQKNATNQIALINLKTGNWMSLADISFNLIFKIDEQNQIYGFDMFGNDSLSFLDSAVSIYKYDSYKKSKIKINDINTLSKNIFSYKSFHPLIFFWKNNWYYYDESLNKKVAITASLKDDFYSKYVTYTNEITNNPISFPLEWNERGLFFTSEKDIWYFDFKTKEIEKKTNGDNKGRSYQIASANYNLFSENWIWSAIPLNTNNYKDLILHYSTLMNTKQGISFFTDKEKLIDLTEDQAAFTQIKRSKNFIIYIKEKPNSTPKMYLYDIHKRKESLIYDSNSFDTEVEEVLSKYEFWKKENGEFAGGILRFPKNYNPKSSKKYPVIVFVYDKKYHLQNTYFSPEMLSVAKINFRTFIADDYFVLEPDIYYKVGETGNSALNSVNEVIDYFAEKYPLDTSNIGIYGHSFGGYETNFIITHTNRFKAAITSAGVAEIISEYFNYSQYSLQPNLWRYENHQFRLGKNFYQDKEMYIKNSPLFHAQNVETPLLLITGNKDYVVNWQQSLLMFNALKKLNKEVTLLIYENEDHYIHKEKNQKDVSLKVKQWFDYYLKDKEKPKWLD